MRYLNHRICAGQLRVLVQEFNRLAVSWSALRSQYFVYLFAFLERAGQQNTTKF